MALTEDELVKSWTPAIVALDPYRQIRVQEVDTLYSERAGAPSGFIRWQLKAEATTSLTPRFILCGARGSGKTTEMIRLGRTLQDVYTVLHVDIGAGLPKGSGTLAVVLLLGVAGLRRLTELKGESIESLDESGDATSVGRLRNAMTAMHAGAVRISELVAGVGAILTVIPGGGAAGATLAASGAALRGTNAVLSALRPLERLAQTPLGVRITPEQQDNALAVVAAVNSILRELHGLSGLRPLLLADGIDKMTRVEDVDAALENEELFAALEFPLVLTGPVSLRHDPRFNAKRVGGWTPAVLYNVGVTTQGGEADAKGIATLMDVYQSRARQANLVADLYPADALRLAAQMSSGIVREFLEILKKSAFAAMEGGRTKVTVVDLTAAVTSVRHSLQNQLNDKRIRLLAGVARAATLPDDPEADLLLFENFISCYPNGDVWYRPHETLVRYVLEKCPPAAAPAPAAPAPTPTVPSPAEPAGPAVRHR